MQMRQGRVQRDIGYERRSPRRFGVMLRLHHRGQGGRQSMMVVLPRGLDQEDHALFFNRQSIARRRQAGKLIHAGAPKDAYEGCDARDQQRPVLGVDRLISELESRFPARRFPRRITCGDEPKKGQAGCCETIGTYGVAMRHAS